VEKGVIGGVGGKAADGATTLPKSLWGDLLFPFSLLDRRDSNLVGTRRNSIVLLDRREG